MGRRRRRKGFCCSAKLHCTEKAPRNCGAFLIDFRHNIKTMTRALYPRWWRFAVAFTLLLALALLLVPQAHGNASLLFLALLPALFLFSVAFVEEQFFPLDPLHRLASP